MLQLRMRRAKFLLPQVKLNRAKMNVNFIKPVHAVSGPTEKIMVPSPFCEVVNTKRCNPFS
jgi:hypothetical protein